MTWPDSGNWPCDGENDIYETNGGIEPDYIHTFVHYGCDNRQEWFGHGAARAYDWHELVLEWEPDALRLYRDGMLVWTLTDPAAIARSPHHLTMQLDPRRAAALPAAVSTYVDYVRISTRS